MWTGSLVAPPLSSPSSSHFAGLPRAPRPPSSRSVYRPSRPCNSAAAALFGWSACAPSRRGCLGVCPRDTRGLFEAVATTRQRAHPPYPVRSFTPALLSVPRASLPLPGHVPTTMDAVPTPHNPAADMEARARAPPPSTSVVTCVACRVRLHGPDTRRAHYLSDWHRANIKRKLAGLPPLTPDEYTRRVEALAAASGGGDGAGRGDGGGD